MTDGIWTVEYRPSRLEEILDQEETLSVLKSFVGEKKLPNILLYGPEGTGKTSTVYAISRALYNGFWKGNLVYFDASDFFDRGKRYIRDDDRYKRFYNEQKSIIDIFKGVLNEYAAMMPMSAEFRIIFFNHAEYLSCDAQQALRRMMERYYRTTRFAFATSHPSKLIPAIRSRCVNLCFRKISPESMGGLLKRIAEERGVEVTADGLKAIVQVAKGDARRAINILQASSLGARSKVDAETITNIEQERKERVLKLIEFTLDRSTKGDSFVAARDIVDHLLLEVGLLGHEIIDQIHDALIWLDIPGRKKAKLLTLIGDADVKMLEGLNDRVHLEEMLSKFMFDLH
jgi:replication factor C small subunit